MANPQINISSLDFDGLKSSLKQYLKGLPNSDLNSFNYDGSAINTLLDVFSYNTLYYAYYANMIANEMFLETAQLENNFVSLLKPLGILLPSRTCSTSEITAISSVTNSTVTAYETYFIGINSAGLPYRFYTTENVSLSAVPTTFDVYEATSVVKDFITTVDIKNQKAFIGTKDLDINTLKVTVTTGGVEEQWSLYNDSTPVGPEAKVYFVDRTNTGFYLLFGKRTINDFSTNYGKTVTAADIVKISYLIPNGEVADGVSTYSSPIAQASITEVTTSAGGRLTPDLEVYRHSAPKLFAANDRAVTKDDYYGLLLNSGLLPANITTAEQLNVWGGEEAFPPSPGRVFVSFADESLTINSSGVKNTISYLKKKCPVTVLPEYTRASVIPVEINLSIPGTLSSTNISAIKNAVNNYYNSTLKFNTVIDSGIIRSLVTSIVPSATSVNLGDIYAHLLLRDSVTGQIKEVFNLGSLLYRNVKTIGPYVAGTVPYANFYGNTLRQLTGTNGGSFPSNGSSANNPFIDVSLTSRYADGTPFPGIAYTGQVSINAIDRMTVVDSNGLAIEGKIALTTNTSYSNFSSSYVYTGGNEPVGGTIDYVNGIITVYKNWFKLYNPAAVSEWGAGNIGFKVRLKNDVNLSFLQSNLIQVNTLVNGS